MSSSSPAAGPQAPAYLEHRQILAVMSGLMLGMLLAALDQTIVSVALPTIVGEFGGLDHLSWVVTAYLLTSTASTPLYGKISDIYGRRPVFQFAIVTFLVGSVLCGLAQDMGQLIAFRALQGLGGGGLMALTFAIIGDVIPPRERGRYQGYFGAVWGLSSVAGPLLGGFFVDGPGWRLIFHINIPLGLIALVVTTVVLRIPHERREHVIDYLGAALLVGGVSALLLVTVWGGSEYAWTSSTLLGLAAAGIVLVVSFVLWERRAAEPILPPSLFRNPVFSVSTGVGLIVGVAMFGAIVFLPIYLQVVDGVSPTASGLRMLPLMLGILVSSIGSGRAISRMGRYKVFPIVGTAVLSVGMFLLSRLDVGTPAWLSGLYMLVVGLGLGFIMQVLIVAVQNSVDYRDMGVATSASTFFRSVGGSFGVAIFGAILNARLAANLATLLPGGTPGVSPEQLTGSPAAILALPPQVRDAVIESFVRSLQTVFLSAVPIVLLAFALSWFIQERPLRGAADTAPGGTLGERQAAAAVPAVGD